MSEAFEQHEEAMTQAFVAVLRAEEVLRVSKNELDDATARLGAAVASAETALADAWAGVRSLIEETGEVEVVLPGTANDYRIHWTTARESVKVDPKDIDALPEQFVKTEKKPKLKEIGDHIKTLRADGQPAPNWAKLERGEPKLTWTAVKKGGK